MSWQNSSDGGWVGGPVGGRVGESGSLDGGGCVATVVGGGGGVQFSDKIVFSSINETKDLLSIHQFQSEGNVPPRNCRNIKNILCILDLP